MEKLRDSFAIFYVIVGPPDLTDPDQRSTVPT
jgi:hypothetical protein